MTRRKEPQKFGFKSYGMDDPDKNRNLGQHLLDYQTHLAKPRTTLRLLSFSNNHHRALSSIYLSSFPLPQFCFPVSHTLHFFLYLFCTLFNSSTFFPFTHSLSHALPVHRYTWLDVVGTGVEILSDFKAEPPAMAYSHFLLKNDFCSPSWSACLLGMWSSCKAYVPRCRVVCRGLC